MQNNITKSKSIIRNNIKKTKLCETFWNMHTQKKLSIENKHKKYQILKSKNFDRRSRVELLAN